MPDTVAMPLPELQKRVGFWRNVNTHLPATTVIENNALRVLGGAVLHPLRDGSFLAAQGPVRWQFEMNADGKPVQARRLAVDGEETFVRESPWTPTAVQLTDFEGEWHSEEADASFTFAAENGQAVLRRRPDTRMQLRPLYKDHFGPQQGAGMVIWCTRDADGRVTTLHVGASRMRDVPFTRAAR